MMLFLIALGAAIIALTIEGDTYYFASSAHVCQARINQIERQTRHTKCGIRGGDRLHGASSAGGYQPG